MTLIYLKANFLREARSFTSNEKKYTSTKIKVRRIELLGVPSQITNIFIFKKQMERFEGKAYKVNQRGRPTGP